jgi:glycosyltransferase involved in cell wall biosynthesis
MVQKYRVAMVAACPFPCERGTPVRIYRTAEHLARRGHEVHVVTYHLGDGTDADLPFKIHRIPRLGTYKRLAPGPTYQKLLALDSLLTWKLLRVLGKHSIDLVHAHHYEGLLVSLAARKLTGHSVIYDAHTLLESELPFYRLGLMKQAKRWIGRKLDRSLPARASHVIAVTEEIRRRIVFGASLPSEYVSVVPSGVEIEHFAVPSGETARNGRVKTLVFAGNLAPYQGIDILLKAFRRLRKRRSDVRLLMISTSPHEACQARCREMGIEGSVDFLTGGFEELPSLLARADVALNPRIDCDGYPQKLLNYMAAGKAIVSFAGSAKNLTHRKLGWVVENGDIRAFEEAISFLLDHPELAARLGANARDYVRSELSWEGAARKVERVYERVIGRHATKEGDARSVALARSSVPEIDQPAASLKL